MRFRYMSIYRLPAATLLSTELPHRLLRAGYTDLIQTQDYLYAPGELPVLIVAHVDTVHRREAPEIWYDRKTMVLTAPDGIGGDDRAGVSGILELIHLGFRPHVLFTDGEETGGRGARAALQQLPAPDVKFIIELDRKGFNDSVFYNLDNSKFERYINSFGFKTQYGNFSDISLLAPAWGIAAVNLSSGYYCSHTDHEYVRLDQWECTVHKVSSMLQYIPDKKFQYYAKPAPSYSRIWSAWPESKQGKNDDKFNVVQFPSRGYYDDCCDDYGYISNDDHYHVYKDYDIYGNDKFGGASDAYIGKTTYEPVETDKKVEIIGKSAAESAKVFIATKDGIVESSGPCNGEEEDEEYFSLTVDAIELTSMYGGKVQYWQAWLDKNVDKLTGLMENCLWDVIDKMVIDDLDDILDGKIT